MVWNIINGNINKFDKCVKNGSDYMDYKIECV